VSCSAVLPHLSEPGFARAAIRPGDLLYPIGVCGQVLCVLGRMRAREIILADDDHGLTTHYPRNFTPRGLLLGSGFWRCSPEATSDQPGP
jgi:hypothetical protein